MGRADSRLRDRVIFVEGAPRSGTTWLVTLLATHPDIAGVEAESHLFDYGVDHLFDNLENRHPDLQGLHFYLDREQLIDLARDLCDGVLTAMRARVSGPRTPQFVVEKTPVGSRQDGLDLERKRACYPDAWYLHIVRDREAATRSLMRAPFMPDRSRQACSAFWDRIVGEIRRCLGDSPRYREVSYEALRADPASACRDVFEWLGVRAGEPEMATVRALSRERFSDMGAVVAGRPGGGSWAARRSRVVSLARSALERAERRVADDASPSPEEPVTFYFTRALRARDPETLRSLTHASLELVHRSPEGDAWIEGDAARDALVTLGSEAFDQGYVGEWWASAGGGPGDWWTRNPGTPFCSVLFSGLRGDATRVDFAMGLLLEDGLVRRVVFISAGPLAGRPITAGAPS